MNIEDRKRVIVIQKYIEEKFSDSEWQYFAQLTESNDLVFNHPRLIRALSFGDDDYAHCVGEVVMGVIERNPMMMETIIDYYDIDAWYIEKDPVRASKLFYRKIPGTPSFWVNGYLKVFISHLVKSKEKATQLKESLANYGMSSFVAHEDIEPAREWMVEIELGLSTMDVLVAMVEPGFKESNWTDQEVGFALGRGTDIIPLRMDADPHGFMGKYQGIAAKGRYASDLALEILKIVLKKSKLRPKTLSALSLAFSTAETKLKAVRITEVDDLGLLSEKEMKEILERSNLSPVERALVNPLILKYKAFATETKKPEPEDDLPF